MLMSSFLLEILLANNNKVSVHSRIFVLDNMPLKDKGVDRELKIKEIIGEEDNSKAQTEGEIYIKTTKITQAKETTHLILSLKH